MAGSIGHGRAKFTTGTRLGSSADRGWKGLLAERWRHAEGDLGEVQVRDTEVIVMLQGRLHVRRRGDGRLQRCDAVPGTVWLCPKGVYEDMIHLYGEVEESIHLFLPASPLSETALRELDIDPDKLDLHYDGGFHDPLIERIARAIHSEMVAAPAGDPGGDAGAASGSHLRTIQPVPDPVRNRPRAARRPPRLTRPRHIDTHLARVTIRTLQRGCPSVHLPGSRSAREAPHATSTGRQRQCEALMRRGSTGHSPLRIFFPPVHECFSACRKPGAVSSAFLAAGFDPLRVTT